MSEKKRIVQLSPHITSGDAVSSDIFMMADVLSEMGYQNLVVCNHAEERVRSRVMLMSSFKAQKNDIFIYHMSIGNEMSQFVINADVSKKLMVYHNITPYYFFDATSELSGACKQGRIELKKLASSIEFAICDSDYNKEELNSLRYKETAVLPIVFNENDYRNTKPDEEILKRYSGDGFTNILFVGRIAPNKKQEDIIHSFHLYNKYINPKSRLLLVGGAVQTDRYMRALNTYISDNNIQNVIFTGRVSFPQIISYYKLADIFLCESEHEGFCVPLLEAMVFDVPILAYSSSAIPGTLGNSGVIFTSKNHDEIAELINLIVSNDDLKGKIILKQQKRIEHFYIENTKQQFKNIITPWIE